MPHRENKPTEVITVLGQRGSGKSSWVQKKLPSFPRFILVDTLGEYSGFRVVTDKQELFDLVWNKHQGIMQIIYNSIEDEDFGFVCSLVEEIEDIILVVEEVDNYCTPMQIPVELKRLLKYGRHKGISMVFVSRRPAEINRLITSQTQRYICFTMIEPSDIRYMSSVIGHQAKDLPSLPKLQYIDWTSDRVKRLKIKW